MAIRWLNNYHRGFNRLWLVLSFLAALLALWITWESRVISTEKVEDSERTAGTYHFIYESVFTARVRAFQTMLVTFIVIFGLGHGVFLVAYWIIRGFRKR